MSSFTYQHFLDAQNKLSGIASVSGIKVVFSDLACDPEYELVKRSWKERLFTRPWEPRRKYDQVMTALNPQMYKMNTTGGEMIVAHPTFKEQLRHLTSRPTAELANPCANCEWLVNGKYCKKPDCYNYPAKPVS